MSARALAELNAIVATLRDMASVIAHPVIGPMAVKAAPATLNGIADDLLAIRDGTLVNEPPALIEPSPGATTDGAAADACVGAILGGGR